MEHNNIMAPLTHSVAYSAWAIGSHEAYIAAVAPSISFMSCFLFLFYSLTFECFALANNLLRYSK